MQNYKTSFALAGLFRVLQNHFLRYMKEMMFSIINFIYIINYFINKNYVCYTIMLVICYKLPFCIENSRSFGVHLLIKRQKTNPMNWNRYTSVILFLFISLFTIEQATACGFDFTGSCATTTRFSVNNVSKEFFVSTCSYGLQFPISLGTGLTNLQLTNATTRTWESCTNNVMQSAIFYRIYKDSLNQGTFVKADLQQLTLFNSPPYRTKTYTGTPNSDLLQGLLANTDYTIEVYYQIFVDTDGNNTVDETPVLNNSGAFYKSTFQTGNISTNMGFPVNGTTTNITCNGGNNASATAVPAGGIAPYSYLWSNNATTATITGLQAGNYSVTVTDATSAIGTRSFMIIEPPTVGAILSNTNPGCALTNGSIIAAGFGGTSPYTYLWSTGATTPSVINLAQGAYSVTVKDVNNCTGSSSTTLIENCGGGNTYCASNSQAPWGEWLARVQLNTLDNASDKTRPDRYAVGYSDWKDKSTMLTKGLSYPLSIMPNLSWSGAQTNLFYRVWIDFNKNGVFEDTEKVFEQNKIGLVAASGTVIVPASALTGGTVMRVSLKKDAYSTACETFAAGEVEDYSIILQAGSSNPCANDVTPPSLSACPQNMSLTTTGTTAVATWTPPTATDNCTANPIVSSNFTSGQSFALGSTTVTYTASDSSNNTATCGFTVSVSKVLATPTVVLKNSTHSVQKNQKICTSVTVDSFSNILSAQWVSLFTPSVLRFDSVINLNPSLGLNASNFGAVFATAGEIRFSWNTATAVSRPNGEKLYDMCFTAIGNGGTSSAIRIDSARGTVVEVVNNLFQTRRVVIQAGTVSVIDTAAQTACKKYPVSNTNEICQQTWKPYGMKLVQLGVSQMLQAQTVTFENSGTTAVLRGTYRTANWSPVQVTINFTGGTTVAPVGSPVTSTCSGNGASYSYFTAMAGTVVINGQTLTIARRGATFQVGTGANLQNLTDLGASGQFTLSDGTLGEFGFKLGAQTPCAEPDPVANFNSNNTAFLQLNAHQEFDKSHLFWTNNTSFKNDYFEIQKADAQGDFKTIDFINEIHYDTKLHDYTFSDSQIVEGHNTYRIKTVFRDGNTLLSEVKTLKFANFNRVVIFPNPASDKVFLGLKQYDSGKINILIYNNLGSLMKQYTVSNTPNVPVELDINSLKSGYYFMRIVAQGKRDVVKSLLIGE